jgi:CubicO group peptidase (beta-lactamase class C family)
MRLWISVAAASVAGAALVMALNSTIAASPARPTLFPDALTPIADIVRDEIARGHIPGAVVLIGQGHDVLYRQAFGVRTVTPRTAPMTVETIFDLASLTKVVATTTAVMQLVEQGRLRLDERVSSVLPRFGVAGKTPITIRHLLTHYSGLKPDLNLTRSWAGYHAAMDLLAAERPLYPIGTHYVYSDENFEWLGDIVGHVSGMPLDRYCDEHIFRPLGMNDTRFRPTFAQIAGRLAPTSPSQTTTDATAVVNDPTAHRMGGVAGHAGLFSTADDLATFATMLLDDGSAHGVQVLRGGSVAAMTQAASPPAASHPRGLGWDLAGSLVSVPDGERPAFSYGHTGFTGTMLWIDPRSRTYIIVLSNRTYSGGRGDAQPLRHAILEQVSLGLSGGRQLAPATGTH